MIDYDQLQSLASRLAVPTAVMSFPDGGEAAVRAVYRTCKRAFATIAPFQLRGPVTIFSQVEPGTSEFDGAGVNVSNISDIRGYVSTGFAIEVDASTESLRIWPGQPQSIDQLSSGGVVFVHDEGIERFLIADSEIPLPRLYPGAQSFFGIPNFSNLDDALAYYKNPLVRSSDCPILSTVWYDDKRFFLIEGPEDTVQCSLHIFLRNTLRGDAEVMREQNVDKTHPVDIRVNFHFTNNVALIEVKWLGKSKHPDGSPATEYTASRARDGAKQLACYLDRFTSSSPLSVVKGYLVVLDARRRGLDTDATSISEEDGMYYAYREIEFEPRYHLERSDFNQPLRMFAEPVCS